MLSAFGLKLPARSSLASQDSQVQWNEVWWSLCLCILMRFMNLMVGRFCVLSWMLCVLTQCFAWSLLRMVVIKHEITWVRSPMQFFYKMTTPCSWTALGGSLIACANKGFWFCRVAVLNGGTRWVKVYVSHFLEVLGYVNINTSRIVLKIARPTPAMYHCFQNPSITPSPIL